MLALPAIARIPKTESTQRMKNTPAISRKGEGRIPISQRITPKIKRSHKVMTFAFKLKSGMLNASIGPYPINQRNISNNKITVNILF